MYLEAALNSRLKLRLCIVKVPIQHLNDGIFPVHLSLVTLTQHFYLTSEVVDFGHTHDFPPLVVNLDTVQFGILLLSLSPSLQGRPVGIHLHFRTLFCLLGLFFETSHALLR